MITITEKSLTNIFNIPTEILTFIFAYLKPKCLLVCRVVCLRWRQIIDQYNINEIAWRKHCRRDYPDIWDSAHLKSNPGLRWYHLYRSLTLWSKLSQAHETRNEFTVANNSQENIKHFEVLSNGIIGVHRKSSIVYYNLSTSKELRQPVTGRYHKYTENDNILLVLNEHNQLSVIIKTNVDFCDNITHTFDNVSFFFHNDNNIYYITTDKKLYLCTIVNNEYTSYMLIQLPFNVISLAYRNGYLYILAFSRSVFILDGNKLKKINAHAKGENILEDLNNFNLFNKSDWKIFFHWVCLIQEDVFAFRIVFVQTHGPIMFVGSFSGTLRIYYSLYRRKVTDLLKTKPLKEYNFLEKHHHPLTACPILHVDVVEGKDSHTLLVAMPKKIVTIKFTHTF